MTQWLAAAAIALGATLSGCATAPEITPARPCAAGRCPACAICPTADTIDGMIVAPAQMAAAPEEATRGRLVAADWSQLPEFGADDPADALSAFAQGCPALAAKAEWQDVCLRAVGFKQLPPNTNARVHAAAIGRFFTDNFVPFRVVNSDETDTGLITGYYEPLLRGSRTQTAEFRYPIYSAPQDLITVDLGEVYPDLKNRRLRGRLVGNKIVPYLERGAIEGETASSANAPLRGLEIAWVDNAVELFFLQIQGSGQIELPDGSRMRVGYADQNGHPFRSLGGLLIRSREIKPERASMQGIKEWARKNPGKVQQYMNGNPSYVFFKELPAQLSGPIGTLGVPLTAERSIAVDPRVIPLGVPVYMSTTFPNTRNALNRLMVAQDTGGAIGGAVRADFFWGFGDAAGAQAGKMKQQGRMWVLLPRGYDPNAPAVAVQAAPQAASPTAAPPTPAQPVQPQ